MSCFPTDVQEQLSKGRPKRAQCKIRRHGGPVHPVYIVNTEKVVDDTSSMRSGVVVQEYRVSDWHVAQKRQHMRRQNIVDVSLNVLV